MSETAPMTKQYKVLEHRGHIEDLEEDLNNAAADGWVVVATVPSRPAAANSPTLMGGPAAIVMERDKPNHAERFDP